MSNQGAIDMLRAVICVLQVSDKEHAAQPSATQSPPAVEESTKCMSPSLGDYSRWAENNGAEVGPGGVFFKSVADWRDFCDTVNSVLRELRAVTQAPTAPEVGINSGLLAACKGLLERYHIMGCGDGLEAIAAERAIARRGEPPTHLGPLNPDWCEWFMGFPIGWTASTALATGRFQEWEQQHGAS